MSKRHQSLQHQRYLARDGARHVDDSKDNNRERNTAHDHEEGHQKYLPDDIVSLSEQLLPDLLQPPIKLIEREGATN